MTLDHILVVVGLISAAVALVASAAAHLYVLRANRQLFLAALKLADPVVQVDEERMEEIAPGQWAPVIRRPFKHEGRFWMDEAERIRDDPWFKP